MNYEYITYLSCKQETIWEYFSRKELFSQFQPAPLIDFNFKVNKSFNLGTKDTIIMRGTFSKITFMKNINFRLDYFSDENHIDVKLTFISLGEMTAVHLLAEHASEAALEVSKNQWPGMLSQLKTLIETGRGLPWPNS